MHGGLPAISATMNATGAAVLVASAWRSPRMQSRRRFLTLGGHRRSFAFISLAYLPCSGPPLENRIDLDLPFAPSTNLAAGCGFVPLSRTEPDGRSISTAGDGDRTEPGNAHQPARRFVLLRQLCDRSVEPCNCLIEVSQLHYERRQRLAHFKRNCSRRKPRSAPPVRGRVWALAPRSRRPRSSDGAAR